MSGLGEAASIIAVIDISAKIFEICQTYVSAVNEARKDIQRLRDGVTSLQDVLTDVKDLAEDSSSSRRSVFSRLTQHDGPVQQCERDLRRLLVQLEPREGEGKMRRFGLRAFKWPFSSKDIDERLQIINDHKATFTLALTPDHFALTRTIKDDIAKLGDGIADMQTPSDEEGQRAGGPNAVDNSLYQPPNIQAESVLRDKISSAGPDWLARITAYEYTPLAQDEDIRVLIVEPGRAADPANGVDSDPVRCKLVPSTLPSTRATHGEFLQRRPIIRYKALSYVWGSEDPTFPLTILSYDAPSYGRLASTVQKKLWIRPNLHAALVQLRDRKEEVCLWVDTICIDQENTEEIHQQVSKMSEIFLAASNVCVWLGVGEINSTNKHSNRQTFEFLRKILDLRQLDRLLSNEDHASSWLAFAKLLRNPWFNRLWTFQEFSAAREAVVHYGQEKMLWMDFADAVALPMTKADQIKALLKKYYPMEPDMGEILGIFSKLPSSTTPAARISDTGDAIPDSDSDCSVASLSSIYASTTASSATSISDMAPIVRDSANEIVILIYNDQELRELLNKAFDVLDPEKVTRNFKRTLRLFSQDLMKEAGTSSQEQAAKFIGQRSRHISTLLRQKVLPTGHLELPDHNLDNAREETIERFLAGPKPTCSTELISSSIGVASIDEDSDHDETDDPDNHPDFTALREWCLTTISMQNLRRRFRLFLHPQEAAVVEKSGGEGIAGTLGTPESLQQWPASPHEGKGSFVKIETKVRQLAVQQGEPTSSRLDTGSYQDLKNLESLMTMKLDDHAGVSHDDLIKEERKSTNFDKHVETEETLGSSNFMQNLEGPIEPIVSQSKIEDDHTYGPGIGKTIYWGMSRYLRPKVKAGYRRLEWQCDCGAPLYGDFHDSDPREVDKLGIELRATGYECEVQDSHGVKNVPTGQGRSNTRNPDVLAPQILNAAQSAPAPSTNPNVPLPASGSASSGVGTIVVPAPTPHPPPVTKKFTALCVNTSGFNKTLGEIDASSISTDRQMFHKFKETYQILRGFRAGAVRWFLIMPVDIKFIQFSVEDSHRVDIISKPPDCTLCASDADIRSRQYEPHLHTSPRTHPPISADAFFHYWQCYSKERSLQRAKWLNRLPKKLDKKLEDVRRVTPTEDDVLGWGIHVIEGLNTALVTFLTFLILVFSGVISVWFSIWKNDVSGGFAIGAYIVALWVAFITALYFQWKK